MMITLTLFVSFVLTNQVENITDNLRVKVSKPKIRSTFSDVVEKSKLFKN